MAMNISSIGQSNPSYQTSSILNTQKSFNQSVSRLSSGLRINSASDDAAGLAISEQLRYQIRGLTAAARNSQNGSAQLAIAEGGLSQSTELLQRMRELAVQSSNGTLSTQQRKIINTEFQQYKEELDRIAGSTEYNKTKLLDGSFQAKYQIGANSSQTINVKIDDMSSSGIGVSGSTVITQSSANNAIKEIDKALETVTTSRAKIGTNQNRLEFVSSLQANALENLVGSESRIRDANLAVEIMNLSKSQLLMQSQSSVMNLNKVHSSMVLNLLQK